MASEKIEKISKITSKLEEVTKEPNKEYFQSLMQQQKVDVEPTSQIETASKIKVEPTGLEEIDLAKKTESTLFDEVRQLSQKVDFASHSSSGELASKAHDVIAEIDTLKNKLQTPNLKIKS